MLAAANGSSQALAARHYLSWPPRLRHGLPFLTDAESLPRRWLAAYVALLAATLTWFTERPAGDMVAPSRAGHTSCVQPSGHLSHRVQAPLFGRRSGTQHMLSRTAPPRTNHRAHPDRTELPGRWS